MDRKDYEAARDAALWTLLRFKVNRLPVRMSNGIQQMGIPLTPYSESKAFFEGKGLAALLQVTDGLSVKTREHYYVFYRGDMTAGRIRFTVAHELGHIVLGHLDRETQAARNHGSQKDNAPMERTANLFASRLLAPSCILLALNASTPSRIAKLCDISWTAARIRARQIEQLKQRGAVEMSPLERELHEQFQDFIQSQQGQYERKEAAG